MNKKDLRGTWKQGIWALFWPLLLVLGLRWAIVEPYIIPSGSMIPNLLISDHIFVKKFTYGLRLPFSEQWLIKWGEPAAGDVIVFRYPESPSIFYVKRLIGKPGDVVVVKDGRITVNDQEWKLMPLPPPPSHVANENEDRVFSFQESSGIETHRVQFEAPKPDPAVLQEWVVPPGQYFFMGDNRDHSSDSRVWGFVPEQNLIGRAWIIWLSCDRMLESARFLCDPTTLRWNRLFTRGGL